MNKMLPVYVIEGVDGCGKTTICKKLAKIKGWKYISTPSEKIKINLKKIELSKDEYLGFVYLLYAIFNTSHIIKKCRKKIICDRYYPTIISYSKALNFKQNFVILEKLPIVKPTKIFHIYVDYKVIKERLLKKKNLNLDELRLIKDRKFYDSLIKEYRKLCDIEINATDLAINQVIKKIESFL